MRYVAVDAATGEPRKLDPATMAVGSSVPRSEVPVDVKFEWQPRIRCNDCPGKVYTAGPGVTVENFVQHLRIRQHKEKVEGRRRGGG